MFLGLFSLRRGFRAILLGLICLGPFAVAAAQESAEEGSVAAQVQRGMDLLATGKNAEAAEVLADCVSRLSAEPGSPYTRALTQRAMIGTGQALRKLARHREAVEFFQAASNLSAGPRSNIPLEIVIAQSQLDADNAPAAVATCEKLLSGQLTNQQRLALRRIHIRALIAQGAIEQSWSQFKVYATDVSESAEQVGWAELAQSIGLAALEQNSLAAADAAFGWYLENAPRSLDFETASLGAAWAAARGATTPTVAAERLQAFLKSFPDSPHVGKAQLAMAGCWTSAGNPDAAVECLRTLVGQQPNSAEAARAITELGRLRPEEPFDASALATLRTRLEQEDVPASLLTTALLTAATLEDAPLWDRAVELYVSQLAATTQLGEPLGLLSKANRTAYARSLATAVFASQASGGLEPMLEQACRWAIQQDQWDWLLELSDSVISEENLTSLSPLSIRLLAEARLRANRLVAAQPLYDHLIEARGIQDFDVLLRYAEIALTLEDKQSAAIAIESAAGRAVSQEERSLIEILRAQWYLRAADLVSARRSLSSILEDVTTGRNLRARAQWMLAETYFLQREYDKAIDHYRLVETLDDEGSWTAASLLQAGRAFEQLGRTQDATICYTSLMTQYAQSPYAESARKRLASIGGNQILR